MASLIPHILRARTATLLLGVLLCGVQARANFNVYDGHSYGITSSRLTWTGAEAEAVSLGGHLVAINDAAEQQFIEGAFLDGSRAGSQVLWIGLNDAVTEGSFGWSNGDPLTFTKWNIPTNEPNDFPPGEDYVAMNWQWVSNEPTAIFGSWNDLPNNGQSFGPPGPYFGVIELPFATPEPSSFVLAGIGGCLALCTAWHRRREAPHGTGTNPATVAGSRRLSRPPLDMSPSAHAG